MKKQLTLRYRPLTDTLTAWIDDFAHDEVRRINPSTNISIELSENSNHKNILCGFRVSECHGEGWRNVIGQFMPPDSVTEVAEALAGLRSKGDTLASIRHNSKALWVDYLTATEEKKIEIFLR
jgi:hypothetical protein